MKSYACVDRFEGNFAVCEVEKVSVEDSALMDVSEKETMMIDVPVTEIVGVAGNIHESDILVVEHLNKNVINVYGKDDEEKQRRIERLTALMSDN